MQSKPGYIYLMRDRGGNIKIGESAVPAERAQYITYSCKPVELIWTLRCEDSIKTERALHARFWRQRTPGEWFVLQTEDIEWIMQQTEETICEGFDPAVNITWRRAWLSAYYGGF